MFSLACEITPLFLAATLFIQGMYEVIIFLKFLFQYQTLENPRYISNPLKVFIIYIYIIIYILFYQTKTRFKSNEVIYSHKSLFELCKLSNWNSVIWTHCHSCIIDVEFLSLSLLVHIFLENEVPILDRKVS